jgi:PEGA domain
MARRTASTVFAFVAVSLLTGCVERRFRVETQPPGAYLYINNVPYGPTPVDVPFLYYGDYDVMLVKEGFQTKRVKQPVPAPWYQYPFIDFFAEALYPGQITDIRDLCYEMEPVVQPSPDALKAEGAELRRMGAALPAPRYPDPKGDQPGENRVPFQPGAILPPPRETSGLPAPRPQ